MADRHVLTRIRRLLNLEERSMKLTMPEGLGLLGAIIVGCRWRWVAGGTVEIGWRPQRRRCNRLRTAGQGSQR